jgi:hypothetical protein
LDVTSVGRVTIGTRYHLRVAMIQPALLLWCICMVYGYGV